MRQKYETVSILNSCFSKMELGIKLISCEALDVIDFTIVSRKITLSQMPNNGSQLCHGVAMNRRYFQLFRAWIPSWRFFETLSEQPVLFYRFASKENDEFGEWFPALTRPPRSWYSLALNGKGNLHLACYTLLDQLEDDLSELDATQLDSFSQTPSYQLIQNLVCFLLRENNELKSECRYQFKVCRTLTGHTAAGEEILVSPVYRV